MLVAETIASFLAWCTEHRAPKTVAAYRDRLSTFLRKFGDVPFDQLTAVDIDCWLVEAGRWPEGHKKAGLLKAPDTRRMNVIAFERLQAWAVKYGVLNKPLIEGLEKPVGRMREAIPNDEQAAAIIAAAPPHFALAYRALRICGARPSEFCRMTVENWDRTKRVVVLDDHKTARKTGQPRKIPVGKKLEALFLEALRKDEGWKQGSIQSRGSLPSESDSSLILHPSSFRESGPIFLSGIGRAWQPSRLSTYFRRIRDKLQLPADLVLYSARHEAATKLINSDVKIEDVAKMLGHKNINTTRRYIHKPDELMGDDQDKAA